MRVSLSRLAFPLVVAATLSACGDRLSSTAPSSLAPTEPSRLIVGGGGGGDGPPPPSVGISGVTVSPNVSLPIDSAAVASYAATIVSGGATSLVSLSASLQQGIVRRDLGTFFVRCGFSTGNVGKGTCVDGAAIPVVNPAVPTGADTFVPGTATLVVQLKVASTVSSTQSVPVTLRDVHAPRITLVSQLGVITFGARDTDFVTVKNPTLGAVDDARIVGRITQGTASHLIPAASVACESPVGRVSPGAECRQVVPYVVSPSGDASSPGTLVAGKATVEIQFVGRTGGGALRTLDTRRVEVTLR